MSPVRRRAERDATGAGMSCPLVRTASSWFGAGLPTPSKGSSERSPGGPLSADLQSSARAGSGDARTTSRLSAGGQFLEACFTGSKIRLGMNRPSQRLVAQGLVWPGCRRCLFRTDARQVQSAAAAASQAVSARWLMPESLLRRFGRPKSNNSVSARFGAGLLVRRGSADPVERIDRKVTRRAAVGRHTVKGLCGVRRPAHNKDEETRAQEVLASQHPTIRVRGVADFVKER